MCSNGKTYKQKNGMDYNVSEYAVICFLILTAINVSSKSDNIFTTVTMFKTLTVDISLTFTVQIESWLCNPEFDSSVYLACKQLHMALDYGD